MRQLLLPHLAGEPIVRLYTDDPRVIEQARLALIVIGLIQPFQAMQFIQAGALRGAGATLAPSERIFGGTYFWAGETVRVWKGV